MSKAEGDNAAKTTVEATPAVDDEVQRTAAKIVAERQKNAHPGFFLRAAIWLLSRFPLTKNSYQNWTATKRIVIGWLLWLVCLPIIPIVAAAVWYFHDPEGFKRSPWAKALLGLVVVWAAGFGLIASQPAQLDQNGLYSPIQTQADGEKPSGNTPIKPAATATDEAKQKVANQKQSNKSDGRKFANCTAAFEAGVFDIKRSDPAYDNALDRDNDGIACEK